MKRVSAELRLLFASYVVRLLVRLLSQSSPAVLIPLAQLCAAVRDEDVEWRSARR